MESFYNLEDSIEESFMDNSMFLCVEKISHEDLKNEMAYEKNEFPMLSTEWTRDTNHVVSIDESKFLNDEEYKSLDWYMVNYGERVAFVCVKKIEDGVKISALEVSESARGFGYGRTIVEGIENHVRKNKLGDIFVSPFDSSSEDFWKHIGYEWDNGYQMVKKS